MVVGGFDTEVENGSDDLRRLHFLFPMRDVLTCDDIDCIVFLFLLAYFSNILLLFCCWDVTGRRISVDEEMVEVCVRK
jgi:hypothetical protein